MGASLTKQRRVEDDGPRGLKLLSSGTKDFTVNNRGK
jgi:hypothetical protein